MNIDSNDGSAAYSRQPCAHAEPAGTAASTAATANTMPLALILIGRCKQSLGLDIAEFGERLAHFDV